MTTAIATQDSGLAHDPHGFKQVMSRLAHSVTVVTSHADGHGPRGLTCSAFMSVSADPPIVAAGIHRRSPFLETALASRSFCINVLRHSEESTALVFATRGEDRFGQISWRRSEHTGAPILLDACVAHFDCALVDTVSSGDHVLVFGLVREAIQGSDVRPLVHCQRAFGSWAPGIDDNQTGDQS